ncbi:siroheme decarboxylase subunit beta [Alkaliphilus transvaalensis]|uniref:siroheme decarboxylase subunit beta n=1 Tax=Alkaliphilus transvaalensis TaxID=114628 RepID=UPI00047B7FB9|nr:AsnC family transcriptional regulator [Alkaliphilus transvaalensis]
MVLRDLDKEIIRALQEDFPLSSEPYRELAESLGIEEDLLLDRIRVYLDEGIIRRFGAAIKHREMGFKANAMVVWQVEPQLTKEVGKVMASFPEVSHCYERPTFPQWPYNLFTMVHGKTHEACEDIASQIAKAVNVDNYRLLYSSKEFKKTSMKYFCE